MRSSICNFSQKDVHLLGFGVLLAVPKSDGMVGTRIYNVHGTSKTNPGLRSVPLRGPAETLDVTANSSTVEVFAYARGGGTAHGSSAHIQRRAADPRATPYTVRWRVHRGRRLQHNCSVSGDGTPSKVLSKLPHFSTRQRQSQAANVPRTFHFQGPEIPKTSNLRC